MEKIKENIHNDFENLKNNKDQYFNEFYNNNYNLVYRISFSILKNKENSEDVAQNVFEKIYKLPNEKLANDYESTWLYTVTKNESLQYLRKSKSNVPLDDNIDVLRGNDNIISDIAENEDYKKIVKKLNKKEEQIVSLKVLSDFTFKEIGEILSMPTATVQWYYYKSIKSLKIAISNLAMFVIALVTGIKISNTDNKINSDYNSEKMDSMNEDSMNEQQIINSESTSGTISSQNSIKNNDIIQSLSVDNSVCKENNNSLSIGLISLAGIFLLISVIFSIIFIKHQQKVKNKSSKK